MYLDKKKRYIIYGIVAVICVVAIFLAVFSQFNPAPSTNQIAVNPPDPNSVIVNDIDTNLGTEFKDLFDSELHPEDVDIEDIDLIDPTAESILVPSELNLNLNGTTPSGEEFYVSSTFDTINIASASNIWTDIYDVIINKYQSKIQKIIDGTNNTQKATYSLDYAATLRDGIFSFGVMSKLNEVNKNGKAQPERLTIYTWNYDIKKDKMLTLEEVLDLYGIDSDEVDKEIEKTVKAAAEEAERAAEATQTTVYQRKVNDARYTVEMNPDFFIDEDGYIYVYFCYGNESKNATDALDVIKVKTKSITTESKTKKTNKNNVVEEED